jgi:hypothetical protein
MGIFRRLKWKKKRPAQMMMTMSLTRSQQSHRQLREAEVQQHMGGGECDAMSMRPRYV